MRRLGRQRGNVAQYSRPKARIINDGPPTTAHFTRAPAKPTNHCRHTSRCRGCHDRPADKARSKTKRAHKLRSHDAELNHGLFFHNVMGPAHVARFGGASATEILDFVYDHDCYYGESDDEEDDDDEYEDDNYYNYCLCCSHYWDPDPSYFVFVEFERDSEDDGWCLVGCEPRFFFCRV